MECYVEWNIENTLLLISLVRERPVLWDATSNDHKNKIKKSDAFAEVAEIMGTSVNIVTSKWLSLRGQYNREKKKVTGLKTGSGANQIYVSKWFAYDEMASLMSYNIPQNSISNIEIGTTPSPSTLASPVSPSMPAISTIPTPSPPPPPKTPTPPPKRLSRNTGLYTEAMTTLKAIKERKTSESDEITSFGTYISAQLRKLSPILQYKLKLEIQTLLYKYEMENLEYGRPGSGMSDTSTSSIQNIQSPPCSTYEIQPDIQPQFIFSPYTQPSISSHYDIQPDNQTNSTTPKPKKMIVISKDGKCTKTIKPQTIENPDDPKPRIIVLDSTIVKPADSKGETMKAFEDLLKFNK